MSFYDKANNVTVSANTYDNAMNNVAGTGLSIITVVGKMAFDYIEALVTKPKETLKTTAATALVLGSVTIGALGANYLAPAVDGAAKLFKGGVTIEETAEQMVLDIRASLKQTKDSEYLVANTND